MKTFFRSFALIAAMMMCFLLPSFAAAVEYDEVVDVGNFEEPLYIHPDNVNCNVSFEKDGVQIAEWIGSTRTMTVKGPLNAATAQGFIAISPGAFEDGKKSATIVINGHVTLSTEADGHCIDAWVGEDEDGNPYPYTFELTVTSTGYNASNPSSSASSLTIQKTGNECNGIQTSILKMNDIYIPTLNTNLMGLFSNSGLSLSNVTIGSARSEIGSVLECMDGNGGDITLDNVSIGSLTSGAGSNAINAPGELILRNSQISNLRAEACGLIGQQGIVIENSKLTNASTTWAAISGFENAPIEIQDSELTSIEVAEDCVIYSSGNITLADSKVDDVKSSIAGIIGTDSKLTIRNCQISNLSSEECVFNGQKGVSLKGSKLTNLSSTWAMMITAEDGQIEIQNSDLSAIEVAEDCIIYSPGNIVMSGSDVSDVTSSAAGFFVTDSKATVTDSTFNNVTTTNEYIVHGMGEGGVVLTNCTITNSNAVESGAALGGAKIQMQNSTITNYRGENIVSCSGDISIKDSTLQGVTTWSSVWAGGDLSISNTTLTSTSTEEGAPGLYTDTGNFTLNGVSGEAPLSPSISITPSTKMPLNPTVEDQTAEEKQNQTVTVIIPDSTVEEAIQNTQSSMIVFPVDEAPVEEGLSVTTAKTTASAFESLADTNKAVAIPLAHAEVVMQPEVIEQIAASADADAEIEICVEQKEPQEALSAAQQQAFADQKVAAVITADVFVKEGNTRTKIDFNGEVTLKVPFTPPAGESGHDYVIVFVADNGQTEIMPTYYTNGQLVFETSHFSDFVITTRTVNTPAPEAAPPKTGDNATPFLWLMGMILACGCGAMLGKRRQTN